MTSCFDLHMKLCYLKKALSLHTKHLTFVSIIKTSSYYGYGLTRYWGSTQPDNGGEEDCAHVYSGEDMTMNDCSCSTSLKWICEKAPDYCIVSWRSFTCYFSGDFQREIIEHQHGCICLNFGFLFGFYCSVLKFWFLCLLTKYTNFVLVKCYMKMNNETKHFEHAIYWKPHLNWNRLFYSLSKV